jgi:hypothetical protein
MNPNIDRAAGRMSKWTEDEDTKLKDVVQTHGRKNWVAISAKIPGRTKKQCLNRWYKCRTIQHRPSEWKQR